MQKSVLKILTESGKTNILCDDDEEGADSTELLGINICGFKDSFSVEDGMVDAYNISRMRFTIILFQNFWRYFNSDPNSQCVSNNLILKTSDDDGHSLNTVFSSRSLEYCIISCDCSSDIR